MKQNNIITSSIVESFKNLPDPRVKGRCTYKLLDIIVIVLSGYLAGQNDFEAIAEFSNIKKLWFKSFLDLPETMPSHDTLRRVMGLIDPNILESFFTQWTKSLAELRAGQVISVDAKTVNGTAANWFRDPKNVMARPLALVNVWASEDNVVLGQFKVNTTGTSEQGGMKEALDSINIEGMIITADSAYTSPAIASKIVEKKGHYILPVRENSKKSLSVEVKKFFQNKNIKKNEYTVVENKKGREDIRCCTLINMLDTEGKAASHLVNNSHYTGLENIFKIEYTRKTLKKGKLVRSKNSEGHIVCAYDENCPKFVSNTMTKYFLTNCKKHSAEEFLLMARKHWSIENCLHWRLDVHFNEDGNRIRERLLARNMSLMRKMALNLLTQANSKLEKKKSISKIIIRCTFDDEYRTSVFLGI